MSDSSRKKRMRLPRRRISVTKFVSHPAAGMERAQPPSRLGPNEAAFTLLELMVVITLILILATLAIPYYQTSIVRAHEAVLQDDLFTMRKLIDQYTLDKQVPPQSLDDLVTAGYLHSIPVDPFTNSSETWRADIEEVSTGSEQPQSGVVDVHSGSDEISLEGTPYSSW